MSVSIAVDGPVGAGKTTICDAVCSVLGILHLDTGAMYRALGLASLRAGVSPDDEDGVIALLADTDIDVKYENGAQITLLNGENVNAYIRDQEVGSSASAVSRYPERRQAQLRENGSDVPLEEILREVEARDWQDMHRETDPLRQAEDAVVVDSSDLTFDETVAKVLSIIRKGTRK